MKDWLLVSFIGGVFGTLGDEVVHWGAVYIKFVHTTTGHYLSQLIFPNQDVILPKLLMGEFAHIIAGGTFGVAIYFIFKISGYQFSIIKGAGFSVVMWIIHVAIIPNMVAPRPFIFRTYHEAIIDLVSHLVWGTIAAWYIAYNLSKPSKI
jgi:hypothetical protein